MIVQLSFECCSVFESQLGCEVNNASTLEKALDAFTKSSMAGEVQHLQLSLESPELRQYQI